MYTETDIRNDINFSLANKGWKLNGETRNVLTEYNCKVGRADYVLKSEKLNKPIIIIEAKRKGKDLQKALEQAKEYAKQINVPIIYASDGSVTKTLHVKTNKPLMLNGEEVEEFISEAQALNYLNTNEYYTLDKKVIKSRQELIQIFASANKELRKEGLQAGIERFSEFCNILFLKIFSEQEEIRESAGLKTRIDYAFRWDNFKKMDGESLLSFINDSVLKYFQNEYGKDIFTKLKIKNPNTLKYIIEQLDPLSLTDTNSDIKGDAFEYFLKAYLNNQNKDLGEYFTPRHIVKTMVKLVNPRFTEKVYDPFCGTGGMLIESFKHISSKVLINPDTLEKLTKETIYGGEITRNAAITKMNMILAGDGHNNIKQQDSLKNIVENEYDVIITNMPFSLGNFPEYQELYDLNSSNGNSLCIEHCIKAIKPGGRMAIIVPEGILFDKKYKRLRKYIYDNAYVQTIISLPMGTFKPYTDVKTSILYLTDIKSKKKQKEVWFYTINDDGYTLNTKRMKKEGKNDLDTFLLYHNTNNEETMKVGFTKLDIDKIKKNDYISVINAYINYEFNTDNKIDKLGNYIEECKNTLKEKVDNVEVFSVTNRGFSSSEELFKEQVFSKDLSNYKIVNINEFAYNPSRINIGSIAFNNKLKIGCVSPMYIVFNIKGEELKPKYLYYLLKYSKQVKEQIKSFCIGSVREILKFENFCKIKIPILSKQEQEQIISTIEQYELIIDNQIKILDSYKPKIDINNSWTSIRLGNKEYFSIIMGQSPDSKFYNERKEGMPFFQGTKDFGKIYPDNRVFCSKPIKIIEKDTIMISVRAPVGEFNIAKQDTCIGRGISGIKINNKEKLNYKFIFYYLVSIKQYVENLGNGSTFKGIGKSDIEDIIIKVPEMKEQENIVKKIEKEIELMNNTKEITNIFLDKIYNIINNLYK